MKKLGLLIMPVMAVSFLANCNNGGNTPITDKTYTVVLNAGTGADFDLGLQYIFLNDVKENTLLNECEDYDVPISSNGLDFYHWTDEHGSVVDENTPVTSNMLLTANFYHGPEYERNNLKTHIKDDLWDILNALNWRGPFSEDLEKKEILQNFQKDFLNVVDNPKLNDVRTFEAMREMYHVLKNQLFKVRYENVNTVNKTFNECIDALTKTLNDVITHDLALGKAMVYLNISYFEIINYGDTPISGVCEYAYQVLLNKLSSLSLDNSNLINAWACMARGLMIASYHLSQSDEFDAILNSATQEINTILASEEYTEEDIKILAKLYADYHVTSVRYTTDYSTDLEYIIANYNTKEPKTRFLVELYRNYFSSYASENGSVSSTDVDEIKNKFKTEIEATENVEEQAHYCTVATSFAEGVRVNPGEASYVKSIVNNFFNAINEERMVSEIENYTLYIEAFAAFADATSKIDFNHEIDTNYTASISFAQYDTNATWMIEQIKNCEYKGNNDSYKGMNILSRYVATYSDYGNIATATFSNGEIINFPAQVILDPEQFSMLSIDDIPQATMFLPFYNHLILKSLRNFALSCLNQTEVKNIIISKFFSFSSSQIFRKTYEKLFLKQCCYCSEHDVLIKSFKSRFDELVSKVPTSQIPNFYEKYLSIYYAPYVALPNYKYAIYSDNFDPGRTNVVYEFISGQMIKIFNGLKYEFNVAKYNYCIVRVLVNDYLPNITEYMTESDRHELLEIRLIEKIDNLLANYK